MGEIHPLHWEATSWRCNGLEGKTIIFGPFSLSPGTTTRARPPRRRLGREVVQTGAALRPILGRMHSSNPRPRTRSIASVASVVVVHVRAPVSPPLSLRAACADVRACAAVRTPLAGAQYYYSRARAIAAPTVAMVWPWRPLDCVRRPGSAVPAPSRAAGGRTRPGRHGVSMPERRGTMRHARMSGVSWGCGHPLRRQARSRRHHLWHCRSAPKVWKPRQIW